MFHKEKTRAKLFAQESALKKGKLEQEYDLKVTRLIQSINNDSSFIRTAYLTFLGFTAYIFLVLNSTNDYDLLLNKSILLTIFSASTGLKSFYFFLPWVYLIIHVNLLIGIFLLSKKVLLLKDYLALNSIEDRELYTKLLSIFSLTQYVFGNQKKLVGLLLLLVFLTTVFLMPVVTILSIQVDSLAMQDTMSVWS